MAENKNEFKMYGKDPEHLEDERKEVAGIIENMKFQMQDLAAGLENVDPRGSDPEFCAKLVVHAIDLLYSTMYDAFDTEIKLRDGHKEHTAAA